MSLESVAKKLGVSVATLSRIETNKQGIDLPFFVELAHVIGIEPSAFVGETAAATAATAWCVSSRRCLPISAC